MGAWSKEALGWANVVTLGPDVNHGTLTLPPVETDGTIYRIEANDGSGEYFLLENRQRIGFDQNLYDEGLLVWHIDPDWFIDPDPDTLRAPDRWESNTVNGDDHMGVWLRQADGLDELGQPGGGRGDPDDPFPGRTGNDAFHAVWNPAATSYLGGPTGLTVVDIVQVVDDMQFRLLTRFTTMTVRANGAASPVGLFTVNGAQVDPPATTLVSAPFIQHAIEAIAGEALAPGERRPFVEWSDAPAEPRAGVVTTPFADTEYVAEYGGTQYELDFTTTGGVNGIEPATFTTTPPSADFWFAQGAGVTIEAVPQVGFGFLGWTGALGGQPNPASLTMSSSLTAGADFEIIYSVTTTQIDLMATLGQDLQLEVQYGTPPSSWRLVSGTLPEGLDLSGTGRITGRSIDMGTFPITLEAVDAIGLPAVGTVTLEVLAPVIPIAQLASPFLLSGPPLEPVQLNFLNRQGNGVAGYDLGDFRAWVLANPSLPMSANFKALTGPRTIVLPMRFEENEEGR